MKNPASSAMLLPVALFALASCQTVEPTPSPIPIPPTVQPRPTVVPATPAAQPHTVSAAEIEYSVTWAVFMTFMENHSKQLTPLFAAADVSDRTWKSKIETEILALRDRCIRAVMREAPPKYRAVQDKAKAGCEKIIQGVDSFIGGMDHLDRESILKAEEALTFGFKEIRDADATMDNLD